MRKLILVVAAAACLAPVAALAANPAKKSAFAYCSAKDKCPLRFETSADGKKVVDIRLYNDCSRLPTTFPSIKVRKGRFSKSGTAKNVVDQDVEFRIEGRFVKPGKAVGTYDADTKGCNAKPVEFTAKRVGKAQAGY